MQPNLSSEVVRTEINLANFRFVMYHATVKKNPKNQQKFLSLLSLHDLHFSATFRNPLNTKSRNIIQQNCHFVLKLHTHKKNLTNNLQILNKT